MYNEKTNATHEHGLIVEVVDGDEISSLADLATLSMRISYLIIETKEAVDLTPLAGKKIIHMRMNHRAKLPEMPELRTLICSDKLMLDDVRGAPNLVELEFALGTTVDAPAEMINITILRKTLPHLEKLHIGLQFERLLTHYSMFVEMIMNSDKILYITDEVYTKLGLAKTPQNELYLNYLIERAVVQLNSDKFIVRRGMAGQPFVQMTDISSL